MAGVVGAWEIKSYKMRGQKTDVFNSGVCVVNINTSIVVAISSPLYNLGYGIPPAKKTV